MTIEFRDFDAARGLRTEEAIAAFVNGCWQDSIEDDDPGLFIGALEVAERARSRLQKTREPRAVLKYLNGLESVFFASRSRASRPARTRSCAGVLAGAK